MPADDEYDIFISFDNGDNALHGPWNGWVTHLAKSLPPAVRQKLGRMPRVYFQGYSAEPNRDWDHVDRCCQKAKVFLAVASVNYVKGPWPQREIENFLAGRNLAGGRKQSVDSMFLLALSNLDNIDHPVFYGKTYHKCFSSLTDDPSDTDTVFPIAPDTADFAKMVAYIGTRIGIYLTNLERDGLRDSSGVTDSSDAPARAAAGAAAATRGAPVVAAAPRSSACVVLAQPSEDLDDEAASLRSCLEQYGITVLPEAQYPLGAAEFRAAFAADLARADHVIQLLGPKAGRRPPDLPEGYVIHQAEQARQSGKPFLQWRSINWQPGDRPDTAYDALLAAGTVTASTLEEFKIAAVAAITRPAPRAAEPTGDRPSKAFRVFVHADVADRSVAERVKAELTDFSIFHPDYDAAGSIRSQIRDRRANCDAYVLLQGGAMRDWIERQTDDALSQLGDALPAGAFCLGPPEKRAALHFNVPDYVTLQCWDGDEWCIDPLRQRLNDLSR
jgi:hypothetical protein